MGALDATAAAAGAGDASVVLGRHGGGGSSVMGACPGAAGVAVVTVQGDGVIVYDCESQVRTRAARRLTRACVCMWSLRRA